MGQLEIEVVAEVNLTLVVFLVKALVKGRNQLGCQAKVNVDIPHDFFNDPVFISQVIMVCLVPMFRVVVLEKIQVVLVQGCRCHTQRPEPLITVEVLNHDLFQHLQVAYRCRTPHHGRCFKVNHIIGKPRIQVNIVLA